MITREQAHDIFQRAAKLTQADEVEILVGGGASALTRFANNTIHQNVADENHVLSVRTAFDGRTARATTNKFDEESLKRVVRAAESLALPERPKGFSFIPPVSLVHRMQPGDQPILIVSTLTSCPRPAWTAAPRC